MQYCPMPLLQNWFNENAKEILSRNDYVITETILIINYDVTFDYQRLLIAINRLKIILASNCNLCNSNSQGTVTKVHLS